MLQRSIMFIAKRKRTNKKLQRSDILAQLFRPAGAYVILVSKFSINILSLRDFSWINQNLINTIKTNSTIFPTFINTKHFS